MNDSRLRLLTLSSDLPSQTEHEYISIANESLLGAGLNTWQDYLRRIGRENMRIAFDGDRVIGGLGFYRVQQSFGGRSIPTAGISGVAVDLAERSGGVARQMMSETLHELREEGFPLAGLYASTQTLYRGVGFEQAGTRLEYELPIRCLPKPSYPLPCTRFEEAPIDALAQVASVRAERTNGNLIRTEGLWDRLLFPYNDQPCKTYLIGEVADPQGYVILKAATRHDGLPAVTTATDYAANTPEAMQRLMALLHDQRAMHDRFRWCGGPQDPLLLHSSEAWAEILDIERWLLRILDFRSAIESRGYPPGCTGSLDIELTDELFESNQGRWRIDFCGGRASVQPGGEGTFRLDVKTLAPLYSSLHSASELAAFGRIQHAAPEEITLADQAFAGPTPWMPEIY
ncbi:MAG: GNAT family N-acetyltransferase [Planctomycetota bacterium]